MNLTCSGSERIPNFAPPRTRPDVRSGIIATILGGRFAESGAQRRGSLRMLFMVIERFKGRDPAPIYARLRERGRALPEGLEYVDSWIEANFDRCFQLGEADDSSAPQRLILQWRDLVEFEVMPVTPSKTVREMFDTTTGT